MRTLGYEVLQVFQDADPKGRKILVVESGWQEMKKHFANESRRSDSCFIHSRDIKCGERLEFFQEWKEYRVKAICPNINAIGIIRFQVG